MGVARNVRTMRMAAGETVQVLAAATQIPIDRIARVERGVQETDDAILTALATHYGVSLETLKSR